MTTEKIYRSLTKGEIGVHRGTEVDATDGKICHILVVGEEVRKVADSTFKRWWKLVEETTPEDLEESVEQLNKIKDVVTKEQPTIADLIELNESGEELTEEELEAFKEQSQEQTQKAAETIEAVLELQSEDTTAKKIKEIKEPKLNEVCTFFEQTIGELNGSVQLYSEPTKRVVKSKNGKTVMFYMVGPKGVKLYLKEALDEALGCTIPVEEKYTYPKQFPFRLQITNLDDNTKDLIKNILELYV